MLAVTVSVFISDSWTNRPIMLLAAQLTWLNKAAPPPPPLFFSSPGLDVVEQMLPAVVDVRQLVVDLCLFGLVAGRDELFSELLQVGFVLTEQVDLFHTVLRDKTTVKLSEIQLFSVLWTFYWLKGNKVA